MFPRGPRTSREHQSQTYYLTKNFMEHLNRIELRGVVGGAKTQVISGTRMSKFSVATSRAYRDKDGVAQIDTTWHNIVAWESDKVHDLEKITSGSKVYVVGRLHTQKYVAADGLEKTYYEVIASKVKLIDSDETLQYEF